MTKIVAIGGGEIGRPGHPAETLAIDQEVIKLSGKHQPRVLFLPTAGDLPERAYSEAIQDYYGTQLGCKVKTLFLSDRPNLSDINAAIKTADIVYVGGGNTLRMMKRWRKSGLDHILRDASMTDKVMAGLSAGAICWFDTGLSDSRRYTRKGRTWPHIRVRGLNVVSGLGLHNITICPHYDTEPKRHGSLRRTLKGSNKIAIALEECTALEIVDDRFRIIASKKEKQAYKIYWKDGKYHKYGLKPMSEYMSIAFLATR